MWSGGGRTRGGYYNNISDLGVESAMSDFEPESSDSDLRSLIRLYYISSPPPQPKVINVRGGG